MPHVDGSWCAVSSAGRPLDTFDCSASPGNRSRLCYCTLSPPSLPPSPPPQLPPPPPPRRPPVSRAGGWLVGDLGASCTAACEAEGTRCDEAALAGHNSEVDSAEELSAVLVSLLAPPCTASSIGFGNRSTVRDQRDSTNAHPHTRVAMQLVVCYIMPHSGSVRAHM